MRKAFTLFALVFLLSACREEVASAPRVGDTFQVPAFQWRVVDQQELERVWVAGGKQLRDGEVLRGFVGRLPDGTYVVYTKPPKFVDDREVTTLGHEVLHVVIGEYHR